MQKLLFRFDDYSREPCLIKSFAGDMNAAWYKMSPRDGSTLLRDHSGNTGERAVVFGTAQSPDHLVLKYCFFWREYKDYPFYTLPGDERGAIVNVPRKINIVPLQWGFDESTMHLLPFLDHAASNGYYLIESAGPRAHPKQLQDMSIERGKWVFGERYDCTDYMRPLPEDWEECVKKEIELKKPQLSSEALAMNRAILQGNADLLQAQTKLNQEFMLQVAELLKGKDKAKKDA